MASGRQIPERATRLTERDVHVWTVRIDRPQAEVEALAGVLASDENERAAAFHFDRDRHRYIACRAALRELLGAYLETPPAGVEFDYNEFGKPELRAPSPLRFNVSHCQGWALVALTRKHRVGVDLEQLRVIENMDGLAEDCFSPAEMKSYAELADGDTVRGFFQGWTRKEAFIKACGRGLSQPLTSFDVSLTPGRQASVLRVAGDEAGAARWSMFSWEPFLGFVAAAVVQQPHARLRRLNWDA